MFYSIPDKPKLVRETLCVSLGLISYSPGDRKEEHVNRIQRIINECDKLRPLDSGGNHGNLHTPGCGCEYLCTCGTTPF